MEYTILILLVSSLSCAINGQYYRTANAERSISFNQPNLNEEEERSLHVPFSLQCESCHAIAFQLTEMVWYMHNMKYPKAKLKPESIVIDEMEEMCNHENFEEFGVKSINGINKLAGPGLKAGDAPGLLMGGGFWAFRLETRCREYLGEMDEYNLYKLIVQSNGDFKTTYKEMCTNSGNNKLYLCGGDHHLKLDPGNWKDGIGTSYRYLDDEQY